MIELTIFTPTYNRSHMLIQCYEALCKQSCKDFIWLIIDDGSTDNTAELIKNWTKENKVKLFYLVQKNMGKQKAVNNALDICTTKFFAFLDSDDFYLPFTVEKLYKYLRLIEEDETVAGVVTLRGKSEYLKASVPPIRVIDYYDKIERKYNIFQETCRAYKTTILKKHKYPVIKDKFIPEIVMLGAIDENYKLLFTNEILMISVYREDGYTKKGYKLYYENPQGVFLAYKQILRNNKGFKKNFLNVIIYIYWCQKFHISHCYKQCYSKKFFWGAYPIALTYFILKKIGLFKNRI